MEDTLLRTVIVVVLSYGNPTTETLKAENGATFETVDFLDTETVD